MADTLTSFVCESAGHITRWRAKTNMGDNDNTSDKVILMNYEIILIIIICNFVNFIVKNCNCWLILENRNDDVETLFLPGCHYWWSDRWLTSCMNELFKLHLRVNAAFFMMLWWWPDAKIAVIKEQWIATASLSFYCFILSCCALTCAGILDCLNSELKRWGEAWYYYSWNLSWQNQAIL